VVPSVDLRGGRVVIELPEEIQGDDRADDDADLSPRRPREGGDR
jgi:16S rRNA processing protein RimM